MIWKLKNCISLLGRIMWLLEVLGILNLCCCIWSGYGLCWRCQCSLVYEMSNCPPWHLKYHAKLINLNVLIRRPQFKQLIQHSWSLSSLPTRQRTFLKKELLKEPYHFASFSHTGVYPGCPSRGLYVNSVWFLLSLCSGKLGKETMIVFIIFANQTMQKHDSFIILCH